jgi:hypothetical protein
MTCTLHQIMKEDSSMGRTEVHARLSRQPEVKRLLRGATRRWKNNIGMNLKYKGKA